MTKAVAYGPVLAHTIMGIVMVLLVVLDDAVVLGDGLSEAAQLLLAVWAATFFAAAFESWMRIHDRRKRERGEVAACDGDRCVDHSCDCDS